MVIQANKIISYSLLCITLSLFSCSKSDQYGMQKERESLGIKRPKEDIDEIVDHMNNMDLKSDLIISIPDIKDVIASGYYVDKTEYAYSLMKKNCAIFLSRPRRFGKSLFVSTLEEIAKGNKALFKDYWIGKSDYEWKQYPVIRLSFSDLSNKTSEKLEEDLKKSLYKIANQYNIASKMSNPTGNDSVQSYCKSLVESLLGLGKGYEEQVVVLIDEYDAPFINIQGNNDLKDKNCDVVRNFLTVIKNLSGERKIHLEFVTGVSAYCFNECSSGPNNLCDITLKPGYAYITGYKETDLLDPHSKYYKRIIDIASAEECSPEDIISDMRSMYNGYKFSTTPSTLSVYNPWSTLNFLQDGELDNYWINSGTPTFLIHRFNNKPYFDLDLSQPIVSIKSALTQPKENNLTTVGEMFQSGYLTIDKYQNELSKGSRRKAKDPLLLKFPNNEIKDSFYDFLSGQIGKSVKELTECDEYAIPKKINGALSSVDLDNFIEVTKAFFSSIPYNLSQPHQNKNEAYYHTVLQSILKCAGMKPQNENYTNKGRIDIVVDSLPHVTYIFELKHGESASFAFNQIEDTRYKEGYLQQDKDIVLIGINFSSEERNITDFKYEFYDSQGNEITRNDIIAKQKTNQGRNIRSRG